MKNHTDHTPEPWFVEEGSNNAVAAWPNDRRMKKSVLYGQDGFDEGQAKANVKRAVSCVNGCKGIPDPETMVPELVRHLRTVITAAEIIDGQDSPPADDDVEFLHTSIEQARATLAKLEAPRLCEDCGSPDHVEGSERCRVSYPEAEG